MVISHLPDGPTLHFKLSTSKIRVSQCGYGAWSKYFVFLRTIILRNIFGLISLLAQTGIRMLSGFLQDIERATHGQIIKISIVITEVHNMHLRRATIIHKLRVTLYMLVLPTCIWLASIQHFLNYRLSSQKIHFSFQVSYFVFGYPLHSCHMWYVILSSKDEA